MHAVRHRARRRVLPAAHGTALLVLLAAAAAARLVGLRRLRRLRRGGAGAAALDERLERLVLEELERVVGRVAADPLLREAVDGVALLELVEARLAHVVVWALLALVGLFRGFKTLIVTKHFFTLMYFHMSNQIGRLMSGFMIVFGASNSTWYPIWKELVLKTLF